MATGFVWHESYAWHDTGSHAGFIPVDGKVVQPDTHCEDPETKRRFKNLLEMSGLWDQLVHIRPRRAAEEDILRVHTEGHLRRIQDLSRSGGGDTGVFTVCGPGSYEIALLAAGGVISAVDAVMNGEVRNAYALVRPPGHHAMPEEAQGFCIFSNAAIAGRYALETYDIQRIAFVDWDIHHGNGTETAFWTDPKALTISIHQDRFFPQDRGSVDDIGEGPGEGYSINIPLPPGAGVGAYVAAYERVVAPALTAFKPDLIFVPSGFDAGALDPLGRNMMHSDGYRRLTRIIMDVADEVCDGRIVLCHEGGYSRATVPFYGLAVMETLSGIETGVQDPYLEMVKAFAGQELQPAQASVIERAAQHAGCPA
jgi:acetoin utilization deacetylase AcuC-like enzyme